MTELVSCIMLTHDRWAFVPLALDCLLRQDHPHRELVVVGNGDDAVSDLMSGHPSVRYLRLGTRYSTGTKRNIGCAHARGDIFVYWDDDGRSTRWQLSHQVVATAAGPWWHALPPDEPARLLGAGRPRYQRAGELSAARNAS